MKTISIIIPAHNEEKRIGKTLESYYHYFEALKKNKILDYEILVVINNTRDKTEEIVRSAILKNKKISYLNLEKGGKGYAIIEGFKDALRRDNDLIGFVDADLATSPEAFYDLVKKIDNYDGIIAGRYLRGAVIKPKNTFARIMASRVYNILIRSIFLMPYRDTQCGAKLFRHKALEAVINNIGMTKFAFDVELIYKIRKRGLRIKEVPTIWADKGYATINFWQSGPWMALAIIRLRILNSPLRRFIRIYDKLVGFVPK
ncbi:MAG: glycosyltransferase [Nanoarchaeota archaeon]|nr:glycosyltransferase [Nanoarchaeota archaeon]